MQFRILGLAMAAACIVTASSASAQSSVGRGARDPLQVDVIVGSEGKGMFTGAGVPPGNTPIYAAKDGATPRGIEPTALFRTRMGPVFWGVHTQQYLVSKDGKRFLINVVADKTVSPIKLILNWKPPAE